MKLGTPAVAAALLLVATLASPTRAQDFNIHTGQGIPPSPTYGAATGQTGNWNNIVYPSNNVPLFDTNGQATGVSLLAYENCDWSNCPDCGGCPGFSGSADDQALLGSWLNGDCYGGPVDLVVSGFAPGRYVMHFYTYGCPAPTSASGFLDVGTYTAGFSQGGAIFQGTWSGFPVSARVIDMTSVHDFHLRVWGWSYSGLAGMQIDELDPTGTAMCLGDGTGAACPCGNSGLPGHGCRNSSALRGALLETVGSASLGFDTLGFNTTFEPPNVTSIVLQGDQLIAPVAFGDGLRCAGGNLKRLYVANASASGVVAGPANGASSISTRSADLGDPLAAGAQRVYQVYYRDPDPSFCPGPQGSTFNVSNGVQISWQP